MRTKTDIDSILVMDTGQQPAHVGFTDEELETRSRLTGAFESKVLPWAMWESEHTSYGRAFRQVANYPRQLPLFFNCDHGVMHGSKCWQNETESAYPVFFTWLRKKSELMNKGFGKRSYHIAHPWSYYRRKHFGNLPKARSGTLVFFPHSNATTSHLFDLDQYIADLKSLPPKCQPVAICLSFHDVHAGVHKKLRRYGLPLVTAGHGNSQKFIDRFYSLVYQFRYTTSPNIGSHTFYIMESGVPFFLYGPYPKLEIKNSAFVADGVYGNEILGDAEDLQKINTFIQLMYDMTDEVTPEQQQFISYYLGLDSTVSSREVSRIVWTELFSLRNWMTYLKALASRLRQRAMASA
jgi:hypothetical protein